MMKDIKNCLKLLKHGYQAKTNLVCAGLFVVIGIFFMIMSYEQFAVGATYFFIAVSFVTQTMYMMLFSGFVAASPSRKKVEFRYMDILNIIGSVLGAVIILLLVFLLKPEKVEGTSMETILVFSGLMAIVIYCYMSMSFKSMIIGTLIFVIAFFSLMNATGGRLNVMLTTILEGKTVLAVVIFLAEIAIGIICGHVLRKLLYRKYMSKWAAGAKLRMEQS